MANDNLNNIPVKKPVVNEVTLIKIVILITVFLIPLFIMLFDMTRSFLIISNKQARLSGQNQNLNVNHSDDELDFSAPLPPAVKGDLNSVPKEKIDTLFNNLKK